MDSGYDKHSSPWPKKKKKICLSAAIPDTMDVETEHVLPGPKVNRYRRADKQSAVAKPKKNRSERSDGAESATKRKPTKLKTKVTQAEVPPNQPEASCSSKIENEDLVPDDISTPAPFDAMKFELIRQLPVDLPRRKNDVYVTKRTHIVAQLNRCRRILEHPVKGNYEELFIHGLGPAAERALELATTLKQHYCGSLDFEAERSDVSLTDIYRPRFDQDEYFYNIRKCPSIHVTVFRPEVPVEY